MKNGIGALAEILKITVDSLEQAGFSHGDAMFMAMDIVRTASLNPGDD